MKVKKNTTKIVGGNWKRKNISFLDKEDLRPTLGRVRETLFNWLQQDLTSKTCLDLFAGTGSLSFEALSRNAKSSTILEKDKDIWSKLVQNKNSFNADRAKIINTSAELFLKKNQEKFDIIFFDPPFTKPFLYKLMINLHNHLNPHGLVYFESNNSYHGNEFKIFKSSRVGQVYFHLLIQN